MFTLVLALATQLTQKRQEQVDEAGEEDVSVVERRLVATLRPQDDLETEAVEVETLDEHGGQHRQLGRVAIGQCEISGSSGKMT